MAVTGFEDRVASLDISLFSQSPSQTTDADKRSLLAVQMATRDALEGYVYLEIGSHLGGSIQPHLLDPKCKKIYSIDKRPSFQPDERGRRFDYPGNSTERMLSLLAAIDSLGVRRIECFDGDSKSVSPSCIGCRPNLCFVDGEHTPAAVAADFDFCLGVCASGATIVFHDAQIVFRGLRSVVSKLKRLERRFSAHALSDAVYVLCLDESAASAKLAGFSSLMRKDDLWSSRNEMRLLKWRLRQRVSNCATRLFGASQPGAGRFKR
jgi:hypothetical protein